MKKGFTENDIHGAKQGSSIFRLSLGLNAVPVGLLSDQTCKQEMSLHLTITVQLLKLITYPCFILKYEFGKDR